MTDNGAGGLSSSVGEMAQMSGGARLELDRAPLKYPGLQAWEILISEAQERMTLAVPPDKLPALLVLSAEMGVESTDLGEFDDSGFFRAEYDGRVVALLEMEFLHDGLPPMRLEARWHPPTGGEPALLPQGDCTASLLALLGRLNICSKESMIRQYDHEVQGASVVKPLVGVEDDGPSDAAVFRPVLGSMRGLAISHGICPRYSDLDTYHMAACAVDEAVRAIVAVGGDPRQIAGLDNFCWCDPVPSPGNPEAEFKTAQLVRAVRGLYDMAVAYGVPLISGKDSMKNDYVSGELRISIPPTLLFSAVGIVEDVRRTVTMDAKTAGDVVVLVGDTRDELGGSEYLAQMGREGGSVPTVRPEAAGEWYRALAAAIGARLVSAAHDCSDGGLAVALAEMAFAGGLGMQLDLSALAEAESLSGPALLFSETPSRLVVTIPPRHMDAFEQIMAGLPCHRLGEVQSAARLYIQGAGGATWADAALGDLKEAWQATLKEF